MRLVTCNCGSAKGFWSALDLADTHPQCKHLLAIALQEIRCSAHEIQVPRRAAQKRGFKVFYTIGEPTDNGFGVRRERGGVAWLVDKRLQVRFLKDFVEFTFRSVVFKLKDGPLLTSTLLLGRGLLRKLRFVRLFST